MTGVLDLGGRAPLQAGAPIWLAKLKRYLVPLEAFDETPD
jgi:hypothetical protein